MERDASTDSPSACIIGLWCAAVSGRRQTNCETVHRNLYRISFHTSFHTQPAAGGSLRHAHPGQDQDRDLLPRIMISFPLTKCEQEVYMFCLNLPHVLSILPAQPRSTLAACQIWCTLHTVYHIYSAITPFSVNVCMCCTCQGWQC